MPKFTGLIFFIGLLLSPFVASAGVVDNWVICDTCTAPSDFESAATYWYGNKTTRLRVSVGNPNTGTVFTMWMSRSGSPLSIAQQAEIEQQKYIFTSADRTVVSPSDWASVAGGSGSVFTEGLEEDYAEEPAFRSVVLATKNHILFNVNSDELGTFPSLAGSDMAQICNRILSQQGISNPGWVTSGAAAKTALRLAVKSYFGRGVLVSMIFGNGDVATFELNPGAPGACGYVANTAKDKMGNPLPDPGTPVGGGIGGGSGGITTGGSGPSPRSYSLGSLWMICSFDGPTLIGCYVQPVVE